MKSTSTTMGVGTLLRHVHDTMEGDIAHHYESLGVSGYRPRFSPVMRTLVVTGPISIRDLAKEIGVTHSAASQTVAQMRRAGLVALETGRDGRQRIVHLTTEGVALIPVIEAEWAATEAAMQSIDAELDVPLMTVLEQVAAALERLAFRDRMSDPGRLPPEEG